MVDSVFGGNQPPVTQTGEGTRGRGGNILSQLWSFINPSPTAPNIAGGLLDNTNFLSSIQEGFGWALGSEATSHVPSALESDSFARGFNEMTQGTGFNIEPSGENTMPQTPGGSLPTDSEPDPFADPTSTPEDLLNQVNKLTDFNAKLDDLATGEYLTEDSRMLVDEMRANLADQMDALSLQLEEQKQQLHVQDAIFQFQAEGLGLDMDLGPLEQAIQQEGGVGAQTFRAIQDIANNAALSQAEKNDAYDIVAGRANFSDAIIESIDEMVQNRDDLQKLNEMSDVELLGDQARFFSPMFENSVIVDDNERFMSNFEDTFYSTEMGDVVAGFNDAQFQLFDNVVAAVRANGARSEAVAPLIQNLVQAVPGSTFEQWRNAFDAANTRAINSEKAKEASVDAKKLQPGSEALQYALVEAGQEMGVPDDILTLLSNSAELHALIKIKSGGVAGKMGQGTIRGMGGLSEQMYDQLMPEPWSQDKGMKYELQALLAYVIRQFDGDPIKALQFYQQTGEWGGVGNIGGEDNAQSYNGPKAGAGTG